MDKAPAPTPPAAASGDALFDDFDRREAEALAASIARVAELEKRARQLLSEHPARLREQLSELLGRIRAGQAECDRRAEMLRATLAGGKVRQEEFRALLVNLEMEYAARCRTAEHGTQLVAEELRSFLNKAAAEVSNLCERIRETLDSQKSARPRLSELFRAQAAKAKRVEGRLGRAVASLRKLHARLRALRAERASSRELGREGRQALTELETKLRALADEAARRREQVGDSMAAAREPRVGAPEAQRLERSLSEHQTRAEQAERSGLEAERRAAEAEALKAHAEEAAAEAKTALERARETLTRAEDDHEQDRQRVLASMREVVAERDTARAEAKVLRECVKKLEEDARAQDEARAMKTPPTAAAPQPEPETEKLRERLAEAIAARDLAEEHAKRAEKGLAAMLSKIAHAEAQIGHDPKPLADLRERVQEAIAARDAAQSLADLAAGGLQHLLTAVAEHQEKAVAKDRELALERSEGERTRKELAEAMTKQDRERLKEIFELRAKIEALEIRAKVAQAAATAPAPVALSLAAPSSPPPSAVAPARPAATPEPAPTHDTVLEEFRRTLDLQPAPPAPAPVPAKKPAEATQPVAPLKPADNDKTLVLKPNADKTIVIQPNPAPKKDETQRVDPPVPPQPPQPPGPGSGPPGPGSGPPGAPPAPPARAPRKPAWPID